MCRRTPPKVFNLIVDTGSALDGDAVRWPFALQGHHIKGERFDVFKVVDGPGDHLLEPAGSNRPLQLAAPVRTSAPTPSPMRRGSRIAGPHDGGRSASLVERRPSKRSRWALDARRLETGLFNSQVADGIVGFSWGVGHGHTLFDNLVMSLQAPDVFLDVFAARRRVRWLMGGTVPDRDLGVPWVAIEGSSGYDVAVYEFNVNSVYQAVARPTRVRGACRLSDSGTTFTYLPPWPACGRRVIDGVQSARAGLIAEIVR